MINWDGYVSDAYGTFFPGLDDANKELRRLNELVSQYSLELSKLEAEKLVLES
jgi:hypothetical protein